MGCDIHTVIERKHNGNWVAELNLEGGAIESRDYQLFNLLAGVRGEGPAEPRGLPDDISTSAEMAAANWDSDGHSHSWIDLKEAMALWKIANAHRTDMNSPRLYYKVFSVDDWHMNGEEGYEQREYRMVFWFDN